METTMIKFYEENERKSFVNFFENSCREAYFHFFKTLKRHQIVDKRLLLRFILQLSFNERKIYEVKVNTSLISKFEEFAGPLNFYIIKSCYCFLQNMK